LLRSFAPVSAIRWYRNLIDSNNRDLREIVGSAISFGTTRHAHFRRRDAWLVPLQAGAVIRIAQRAGSERLIG
jgi:hypothetical protein